MANPEPDWLIVGLGNPGVQYVDTPHNVGFEVVDLLHSRHSFRTIEKFQGIFSYGEYDDLDVGLLKPLTWMNLSGGSVKAAARALGLKPDQIIVVHDDVDLERDQVRLKSGGGLAGHNGLKSIAGSLGTNDFHRLRVGVGRPERGDRRSLSDWVLGRMPDEWQFDDWYAKAADSIELVWRQGMRSAMNTVNAS